MFGIVFAVYMKFVLNISLSFNIADKQIENSIKVNSFINNFGNWIVMFLYIAKFLLYGEFNLWLIFFMLISIVLFVVCFLLIKPFFFKVATMSSENSNIIARYNEFKCRSVCGELIVSEVKQVFRSSEYIFQYFLFLIL